ncbi:MAG: response regulator [Acidobacteria bacterium]|nr:response regulator [Acidobacteriota bacterium]
MTKQILAIVEDLFFAVKIEGAAKAAGAHLRFVKTEQAALAAAPDAELILLDLNCKGLDVLTLLPKLPGERVIGFVSHVQTELRQAAADAGCGTVMARSSFSDRLPAILQAFQNAPAQ